MGRRRGLMFWLGMVLAGIVGLVVLGYGVGMLLPRDHVARMTIRLESPPERVWALISDVGGTARWRPDVTSVEVLPATGGPLRFAETSKSGKVVFELVDQAPIKRQVVRVVDEGQPFGGIWTWELAPAGTGTRVTITEAGFVKNPLFRILGKLFFSPTETIRRYLGGLARELGEDRVPTEEEVPVA